MSANTMKAAVLETAGGVPSVSRVARPHARPGEVLVRIAASAVNPLDLKIRQGAAPHARHPFPAILGIDMAGTVEDLGQGVSDFSVGDAVFGMTGGVGGVQGSLAQFSAVDARLIAKSPATMSPREAAALPLAFITAWEGLIDQAAIEPGQTVLVLGGAGAVGQAAIQLAKAVGAQVFATAGTARIARVERLGAAAVDSAQAGLREVLARQTGGEGFDVVFDTAGGESLDLAFHAVARSGHVVSALGWGSHALAPLSFRAATYSGVFTLLPLLTGKGREAHGRILREISLLAGDGIIGVSLDPHAFDLTTVDQAHQLVVGRQALGRVIVDTLD